MPRSVFRVSSLLPAGLACIALAGCGKPAAKPSEAQIAAYQGSTNAPYLKTGKVNASYEAAPTLGSAKLPEGSWRVHVQFGLVAQQDLFAPTPEALAHRSAFDRAVAAMEQLRVGRIAAVEQLGAKLGLMTPGAASPEPAMAVSVSAHKGQALADQVDLLAEPDGSGWKFFQLNAQSLDDDLTGAPLEQLKRRSPKTVFVLAGSDEAKDYAAREARFLQIVDHAPKP